MPENKKPNKPRAVKPVGLPKGKKPAFPPKGAKPAGPPKRKPMLPPGAKPKLPPRPGGRRPAMPPIGVGGDGADVLTRKDFQTDQDVRWCPGCGDYAILAQVQRTLPELGVPKENIVFISGIGCSSRFPYYMKTYGMHSIHGRAPAIATGLKVSRPDLDVWIVTGDGDALSIGGNHLIHMMRRNVDVQLLLFNNQIYGLTKGQYSPTSEQGKVTKSTPYGSVDYPFNPIALILGADATFVARTMDRDPKHMGRMLKKAHAHRGTSFIEIYQNCNIFNDGAFFDFTEKSSKAQRALFLEDGKPLVFDKGKKGVRLNGFRPEVVDLEAGPYGISDCITHDETSRELAQILSRMFHQPDMPRPFGVFYRQDRPTYDQMLHEQINRVKSKRKPNLEALIQGHETWAIE